MLLLLYTITVLVGGVCVLAAHWRKGQPSESRQEAHLRRRAGECIYEMNQLYATAAAHMNAIAHREWSEW